MYMYMYICRASVHQNYISSADYMYVHCVTCSLCRCTSVYMYYKHLLSVVAGFLNHNNNHYYYLVPSKTNFHSVHV